MTRTDDTLVVGVDVGGTKVAAGLVEHNGKIKTQIRTLMVANRGPDDGLAAVVSAIDLLFTLDARARALIRGIGICSPGPLDPKTGVVINPPNPPCWRNFPLAAELERVYGVSVKVENDANAAALAEAYWGAGRGFSNIFYAGIGTGIGTGIVFDGRIYNGRTGAAAEGGHMSIDYRGPKCGCGKRGYLSKRNIRYAQPAREKSALHGEAFQKKDKSFARVETDHRLSFTKSLKESIFGPISPKASAQHTKTQHQHEKTASLWPMSRTQKAHFRPNNALVYAAAG